MRNIKIWRNTGICHPNANNPGKKDRRIIRSIGVAVLLLMSFTTLSSLGHKPGYDDGLITPEYGGALQFPKTFTVSEVLAINQLQGNPAWVSSAKRRFESVVFKFNSDGTFSFLPTYNVRSDLYPLIGEFSVSGNTLTFSAANTVSYTTGSATTEIQGKITLGGGAPEVTMSWISTSGLAANINNTPFASSSSAAYQIRATLR